jgi:hypothetical protein
MKTTVIKVQETKVEIEISYFKLRVFDNKKYCAKDRTGKVFIFETIKNNESLETWLVFENGGLRFNRPVKILEYVK